MTTEEKWAFAIQQRGYLVLAWNPGHKPGDIAVRALHGSKVIDQPMVVLQQTDHQDHVAQRLLLGDKPSATPDGMVWYRVTTD